MIQHPIVSFLEKEFWWGGRNADGVDMPFTSSSRHRVDLSTDLRENQGAPLLLSTKGRYIWSDRPFTYEFRDGIIHLSGSMSPITLSEGHGDLRGAFRAAAARHFPASGKMPPELFFTAPHANTWIDMLHTQTQAGVLLYARGLVEGGYPPGVLMIDAGWAEYWGSFQFHAGRFPDPAAMTKELHALGFIIMLWVSPFIVPDGAEFRRWRGQPGWFLRDRQGTPAVLPWWDGHSVHLDLTHPDAMDWFKAGLRSLQDDYGIDGFKFDAGDTLHYLNRPASWQNAEPVDLTEEWAQLALDFPFNEFRACWKMGGQPVVQRLHDRAPDWTAAGILSLIPNSISQGLLGHAFTCPDLIGGGYYLPFIDPSYQLDEEFFVRYCQCSALMPMMQFSAAPWRVLTARSNAICKAAVELHTKFAPKILELARQSAQSNEPILRSMEYVFPGNGYEGMTDQFLIGDDLLVAPVITKGATTRRVTLPPGRWSADDGQVYEGSSVIEVPAPLERLPHFLRD
jgi:hypothetical protein